MLFLLAAASEWTLVGIFTGLVTCMGAVKLGLETYEKYHDIKKMTKDD